MYKKKSELIIRNDRAISLRINIMITHIKYFFVIYYPCFGPGRSTRFFIIKICDVVWVCMLVHVYVYPLKSVFDIIFNYVNWSRAQNTNSSQTGIFSFSEINLNIDWRDSKGWCLWPRNPCFDSHRTEITDWMYTVSITLNEPKESIFSISIEF